MISEHALEELFSILGHEHLSTRPEDLTAFGTDATKLRFMPDAVAFPGTPEEISRIFELANRELFPVIPRGAGSGKSGGALPVQGGLILAMDRFNRILEIDEHNLIARVECGVITAAFQDAVEKVDLFYPPDPASIRISTLGGNVAECAGGLRAVKYGVTRDYVLGLTAVLPTGEIIRTGVETIKGVVGYDLTRLLIGSEGTLAVITEIIVRLVPKPAYRRTMMAFFASAAAAVEAVAAIIRNKIVPTALEFMDRTCISCVDQDVDLAAPSGTAALLLIEVDGDKSLATKEAKRVKEICSRQGALEFRSASRRKEGEKLWEARRNVSESVYKLRPDKISEDIVVPRSRMAEFIGFLEDLSAAYGLPMAAYGHAGDGNIHVNILFDEKIPGQAEKTQAAVRELFHKVIEMRGTLSGEHGVGITKAPFIAMEISRPALELMARLKKAFDPNGILNPGKIFPYII
ncbi:MAG: FAD-binding oxidoreductase [Deltaproteobacteria bacterium]